MAERWFVVPIETETTYSGATSQSPKYADQVESFSGRIYDVPDDDDLPFAGQRVYLVQFTADTNTLDSIASNDDAWGKQEYDISDAKIAAYLNDLTGQDHTFAEWSDRITS